MQFKKQIKGFSIIELLIVVAIIAILLLLALPRYQVYTIRAQISEAMSLADAPKQALAELAATHGNFSNTVSAITPGTGKYIASSSVKLGDTSSTVTVEYKFGEGANSLIKGETFIVRGTIDDDQLIWSCEAGEGSDDIKSSLPSSC